jgi:hypothetical protein
MLSERSHTQNTQKTTYGGKCVSSHRVPAQQVQNLGSSLSYYPPPKKMVPFMGSVRKGKSIEIESRVVVARGWGGRMSE